VNTLHQRNLWKKHAATWRSRNSAHYRRYQRTWRKRNKFKISQWQKAWRKKNLTKCKSWVRQWQIRNHDRNLQNQKNWRKNNKHKWRTICNRHIKKHVSYRLSARIRSRISTVLRGTPKNGPLTTLLGCSIPDLRRHLENLFLPGMNWNNYGQWHVDHVRPCAKFNLTKPIEQRACFHFTNLQPLWAKENISKGAK